jgi:SAM-dependent methyltransferase
MKRCTFFKALIQISTLSSTSSRYSARRSLTTSAKAMSQTEDWPAKAYESQHTEWPYKPSDFARYDETADSRFYAAPRINIQHIDDHAISSLKRYYAKSLPKKGRIVDLCTSWTSHFPPATVDAINAGNVKVYGVGMSGPEMEANAHLNAGWVVHDLNEDAEFPDRDLSLEEEGDVLFDAATCVVSIDYLTQPRAVLSRLWSITRPGGTVHLVVSDRRFPTKAIAMWDRSSKSQRLQIVGDYLHFAGWKDIEFVDLSGTSQGGFGIADEGFSRAHDPLWVVRGVKKE